MFCLGCGAETPPRATSCAVCGRELKGAAGEVQWTVSTTASVPGVPVLPRGSIGYTPPAPAQTAYTPSIAAGDLDWPGFPRDAAGRTLLIAAVAMGADLLQPWVDQSGQHFAPAQVGLPMLAVVILLVLAVVPLAQPSFRVSPQLAVIPVIVGGMLLSVSLAAWGVVTYVSYQVSQQPQPTLPDGTPATQGPVLGPDAGMYLFMLGSVVLIVTGYHLFLKAARASAPATAPSAGVALAPSPVPAGQPESGAATPVADMSPISPAAAVPAGEPSEAGESLMRPTAPATEAANNAAASSAVIDNGATESRVALPGSAAWHEAPKVPAYSRPSRLNGGWQRQPPTHR